MSEGDILASIETDKATMDFENQDEGFVAKIFKKDGKINVGEPMFIIVDNKEDIEKFENFSFS